MPTEAELRASDVDRDAVTERLAVAVSEGRLQMDEYQERLEQVHTAKTYADLDRLVADLPRPAPTVETVERPTRRRGCCW